MPSDHNIVIRQGDDNVFVLDCPDVQSGDTATAQMRRWPGPTGPLLAVFDCECDAVAKTVTLRLAAPKSREVKRGGVFDVQLSGVLGNRTPISALAGLRTDVTVPTSGYVDALDYATFEAMTYGAWEELTYLEFEGVS